jgi:hypothetical protein
MIEHSAETLIRERATHLDQLADKLREDRVRRVMAPMVAGEHWPQGAEQPTTDDIQYVIDLGLIRRDGPNGKTLVISNDIYKEVIPRELTAIMQDNLASRAEQPWYVADNGSLDMPGLLRDFRQFFRENADSWTGDYEYKEAGFQLMLQAFLQRVVNGGGFIGREYALGSGRVDLLVRWRCPSDAQERRRKEQRIALELKTVRQNRAPASVLAQGLEQVARYADASGADEAHLVICDERPGRSWDEKIYEREEKQGDRTIRVWGM